VVTIPGTRNPTHLTENLTAAQLKLHPDTLARLDTALASVNTVGATLL